MHVDICMRNAHKKPATDNLFLYNFNIAIILLKFKSTLRRIESKYLKCVKKIKTLVSINEWDVYMYTYI